MGDAVGGRGRVEAKTVGAAAVGRVLGEEGRRVKKRERRERERERRERERERRRRLV